MSVLPKDAIKVIAESIGVVNLPDEIAQAMAPDVEYRLREVAQEAMKFMTKSKRSKLTTEDVNNALRVRNLEILYGYSNKNPLSFLKAGRDLYFVEERELEIAEIINAPLPKCPRDTTLAAHWLAIEGIQPAIPQNPALEEEDIGEVSKRRKTSTTSSSSSTIGKSSKIKPLVKQVLSQELQMYFDKITSAIKGTDTDLADEAIHSLSNDPGLQPLLPYFIQFVSDEVTYNIHNLKLLFLLIRMLRSFLDSSYLQVELYLHQMMPPLLTCTVGKKLCEDPNEDHWGLRDYSAACVSIICKKYGESYKSLQPRIAKTLVQAFQDASKPLGTHYGAIVGITGLGADAIQAFLLPHLSNYMKLLEPELVNTDSSKQSEARKCFGALLNAAGTYVHHYRPDILPLVQGDSMDIEGTGNTTKTAVQHYHELYEIFGEALIPFVRDERSIQSPFIV